MVNRKIVNSSITVKEGNAIDYPEALKEQLNYGLRGQSVYVLPPFNRFKKYIFLFPSYTLESFRKNESMVRPHRNFIFYQNRWHVPKKIFKKMPIRCKSILTTASNVYAVVSYCEECLKAKAPYKIPYSYFDLTSTKQIEFKQEAIQPIRDLFSKFGFLTPDKRGKGSEMDRQVRKEIHKVIVATYKKAKKKRPIPMRTIQNEVAKYLLEKFPTERKLYDKYSSISDARIRRILKKEGIA